MAAITIFDQIKTEPIQFYPSNFTTNQQTGTVILQHNQQHGVIMNKNLANEVTLSLFLFFGFKLFLLFFRLSS